jgi:hypothetical protein
MASPMGKQCEAPQVTQGRPSPGTANGAAGWEDVREEPASRQEGFLGLPVAQLEWPRERWSTPPWCLETIRGGGLNKAFIWGAGRGVDAEN